MKKKYYNIVYQSLMLSFKNFNKKTMINELVKMSSILIAIHIMINTRLGHKLFDEQSLYVILFTLLAYAFYHVVIVNIIPPL
jgi:hypothetical protein